MVLLILAAVLFTACSPSPTAPSPIVSTPVVTTTPATTPPVTTPRDDNGLTSDPRFSLAFYRMFALDANGETRVPLRRWSHAPLVYLATIDSSGVSISSQLLDQTAAAIINTTAQWTGGAFGVAGLERGTGSRAGQAGWITVQWSTSGVCGSTSLVGAEGTVITMNARRPECTCGPLVAKHELGHALGYYHTDRETDLMAVTFQGVCDKTLSDREVFHAKVAYSQPIGSFDPH